MESNNSGLMETRDGWSEGAGAAGVASGVIRGARVPGTAALAHLALTSPSFRLCRGKNFPLEQDLPVRVMRVESSLVSSRWRRLAVWSGGGQRCTFKTHAFKPVKFSFGMLRTRDWRTPGVMNSYVHPALRPRRRVPRGLSECRWVCCSLPHPHPPELLSPEGERDRVLGAA